MQFLIETAPTKGPLDGHMKWTEKCDKPYIYIYSMLQTYANPTPPRIWNDWYELWFKDMHTSTSSTR